MLSLIAVVAATAAYASPIMTPAFLTEVQRKATWEAGINERFLNATREDIKKLLGAKIEEGKSAHSKLPVWTPEKRVELPDSFDVRSNWPVCKNVTGHIEDQASCGSCWAVSSTETFQGRLCIATKGAVALELSAQETTSCCNLFGGCFGSSGCDGGIPSEAWQYFVKTGLVTGGDYGSNEGCFPYQLPQCAHHVQSKLPPCQEGGSTPACPNPKSCSNSAYGTPWAQDKHFAKKSYGLNSVQDMMQSLVQDGGVTVAFTVYEDFLTYKSGVYRHQTGSALGGHAVEVIGYGTENGEDYWLVKNSWNKSWGAEGLFKIAKGVDECGIEDQPVAGDA